MNLNRTENPVSREQRNRINENWNILEREFNTVYDLNEQNIQRIRDVDSTAKNAQLRATQARDKSEQAQREAESAKTTAEYVQSQLDNVVAGGDNITEVVQARKDKATLRERLDEDYNEVKTEIVINKEDSFFESLVNHKRKKAIFTIIDDDASYLVYDVLFPMTYRKNVKINSAVVTGQIGTDERRVNLAQLKEMQESGMIEMLSHTVNHLKLDDLSLVEAENEIRDSKQWLIDNGFKNDFIVSPYGGSSADTRKLIRNYYKGDFVTSNLVNLPGNFSMFRINRIEFDQPIEDIKAYMDQAAANGGWIVLATHVHYPSFRVEDLEELIDYARSLAIDILPVSEAVKNYGNLIDIGDYTGGIYGIMDSEGNLHGTLKSLADTPTTVSPNANISEFPSGQSSRHFSTNNANAAGLPMAGVLKTTKSVNEDYSFQELFGILSNRKFFRYWDYNSDTWSAWSSSESIFSIDPNSNIQSFTDGESIRHITSANATTFNLPAPGIIKTVKTPLNVDFSTQTLYKYQSDDVYKRYWINGAWSEWMSKGTYFDIDPNSPIENFLDGETIRHFPNATANSFNLPAAGVLKTIKVKENPNFSIQILYKYQSDGIYTRNYSSGAWSEWIGKETFFTISPNSDITNFTHGESINHFTSSQAVGYGLPGAGTLKTVRALSNNYSFQELNVYQSNTKNYRYWVDGSGWSAWV